MKPVASVNDEVRLMPKDRVKDTSEGDHDVDFPLVHARDMGFRVGTKTHMRVGKVSDLHLRFPLLGLELDVSLIDEAHDGCKVIEGLAFRFEDDEPDVDTASRLAERQVLTVL